MVGRREPPEVNEPRQIPMIDLKTQLENLRPEIDEAIDRVLSSTAFVFGPDIKALEE
jgi:UDP-2-acetamido-2-deoxy-ribo-hexuluronate aminotransferase